MPNDPNQPVLQRIERIKREQNRSGNVQDMMLDTEPSFFAEILTKEVPEDFKMSKNLVIHLATF